MSAINCSAHRALAVIGTIAVVAALSACATPGSSAPGITPSEIRIGTHAAMTGGGASAGVATRAMGAYFAYVNAHGGVHGRRIELDVVDDHGDPVIAKKGVEKLVHDDVFAIVGASGASTHAAVAPSLSAQGVPDLFVESGSSDWSDVGRLPWTFGYTPDHVVEAQVLAGFAQRTFADVPKCLLASPDDSGESGTGLLQFFGADGLVARQSLDASGSDVAAAIASAQASGCALAFLSLDPDSTAKVLAAADRVGWHPEWLSSAAGADYDSIADALGEDAPRLTEGFLSTGYVRWGDDDRWAAEFRRIAAKYAPDLQFSADVMLGMSVGYTFVETMMRAGANPTRADVRRVLESGRVRGDGLMPMTYTATDHSAFTGLGVMVVSGGRQSYVGHPYLTAHATSEIVEYVGAGVPFSPGAIPQP